MKSLLSIFSLLLFNICLFAQTAPDDVVGRLRGSNGSTFTFTTTGTYEGSVWGGADGIYTDDSRLGKAAVHAGLLKAGQTGTVSVVILAGKGAYQGSLRNGVTTNDYGEYDGSFKFGAATAPSNMTAYRSNKGTTYTFNITGSASGGVWGGADGIYSDDSYLSAAAVHAGVLGVGESGVVDVTVMPGQPAYKGTTANGIVSNNYGAWAGSYRFGKPAIQSVADAPANVKAYRENAGKVYTFRVTGSNIGNVWGGANGIYTDDSELGAAAVHAGKVKPGQEAIIRIKILRGEASYKGSTKNGIISKDYGSWDASFKFE